MGGTPELKKSSKSCAITWEEPAASKGGLNSIESLSMKFEVLDSSWALPLLEMRLLLASMPSGGDFELVRVALEGPAEEALSRLYLLRRSEEVCGSSWAF